MAVRSTTKRGVGLPSKARIVVSTPAGLAGLDLRHRKHCYVFETARDLADCLREILRDPTEATTVADNGRLYAERNFAPHVLRERWREILDFTLSQNTASTIGVPLAPFTG